MNNELHQTIYAEFIRGFAQATGLEFAEAEAQLAAYSHQLSDTARYSVECYGYEQGVQEGNDFNVLYK